MSDSTRPIDPDSPLARRAFLARMAALSALAAAGSGVAQRALAQAAKPVVDPPGTVANEAVLAAKAQGFPPHSARPLTGSLPAEYHDFDVTPNDRMFIRNNLLTPDLSPASHVLRVRGLVDKPLDIPLAELKKMPSVHDAGDAWSARAPAASVSSRARAARRGCRPAAWAARPGAA